MPTTNLFTHVEHIGIAVKDLTAARLVYTQLLNTPPYKHEEVESEGVSTLFFMVGNTKIELLAATTSTSPIANFIAKRGEGLHHIAYAVPNIVEALLQLSAQGFTLLNPCPKPGADNKWICFIHPKNCNGVLTELCQDNALPLVAPERLQPAIL